MRVGFAPMVCLQVCFEVKITKNLPTDFGDDHQEADPHVVRVGWSIDSHGFQLGITGKIFLIGRSYRDIYDMYLIR